ncbi:prolyl-tRNA synthetase associated domain-containing protein [Nitratireductor sp. StC3]|uniref:prolyl-tRNA synthetase associated domain-containing protein n=1 Tax=Nitratireductor sp. StC3 TaxID=2126741 RepID=UPI000D0D92F4|nr:prolyl-tRNA synthetase associated domain-containing protein [Nitratireductor sp. StC3]PSM19292.1 DNA-binding protein [Nitratireductor sp. StC3]
MAAKTRADLLAFLEQLAIEATTIDHPPLYTVAQSQALRGTIDGGHTKNLFLKDKKGRYFLVTVEEEATVDLKSIHRLIGASGRVSFGSADALMRLLGVEPGSVTVFGLINDVDNQVTLVLDAGLMRHELVNCHPLTNDATTQIAKDDLVRFLDAIGHQPAILNVTGQ